MRKLILKRKKTMTASLAKIKVFIEHSQGELEINGKRCKEIGTLKNGETGEYEIPDFTVYLFVFPIFKKIDPTYHAYYQIPAGEKNIHLFVAPKLDPMKGNPFTISTTES